MEQRPGKRSSGAWQSPAKVNLHLQVVGRRADGYHELRTLFQSIDLADRVGVSLARDGIELEVTGAEVPVGPGNLAWRAAQGFLERWGRSAGVTGVRLRLDKRIPVGGGLGGGSSNAATVLLALQELTRELGSDVPYFLVGGTAFGCGRGDEVVPLPELPESELLLVLPPVHIATPEVFAGVGELTPGHLDPRIMALVQSHSLSWEALSQATNDLEKVVFARWPSLAQTYASLREAGGSPVRLSGSGAVIFARFAQDPGAGLVDRLPGGCRIVRVRTLSRDRLGSRRRTQG
jgi:4-diphosphocytidyl-2-C-methyl-D-erythritol kinase